MIRDALGTTEEGARPSALGAARVPEAASVHVFEAETAHAAEAETGRASGAATAHTSSAETAHTPEEGCAHIFDVDSAHISAAMSSHAFGAHLTLDARVLEPSYHRLQDVAAAATAGAIEAGRGLQKVYQHTAAAVSQEADDAVPAVHEPAEAEMGTKTDAEADAAAARSLAWAGEAHAGAAHSLATGLQAAAADAHEADEAATARGPVRDSSAETKAGTVEEAARSPDDCTGPLDGEPVEAVLASDESTGPLGGEEASTHALEETCGRWVAPETGAEGRGRRLRRRLARERLVRPVSRVASLRA